MKEKKRKKSKIKRIEIKYFNVYNQYFYELSFDTLIYLAEQYNLRNRNNL